MRSYHIRTGTEFKGLEIPNISGLYRVEYLGSDNPPIAPHIHRDSFEIVCHYEGTQHYELGGMVYEVRSGDVFIAMPNELHGTGAWTEEKSKFYYMIFSCMPQTQNLLGLDDAASDYIRDTLFSISTRLFHGTAVFKRLMEEMMRCGAQDTPFRRARMMGLLVEFFYQLTELLRGERLPENSFPPDIRMAANYMEEHLDEKLRAEELARMVHLSLPQFQRKFRLCTGFSPHDYLLRVKIARARELLSDPSIKITEISQILGFSSSQHFSNVFRQYVGHSPTGVRERLSQQKAGKI